MTVNSCQCETAVLIFVASIACSRYRARGRGVRNDVFGAKSSRATKVRGNPPRARLPAQFGIALMSREGEAPAEPHPEPVYETWLNGCFALPMEAPVFRVPIPFRVSAVQTHRAPQNRVSELKLPPSKKYISGILI